MFSIIQLDPPVLILPVLPNIDPADVVSWDTGGTDDRDSDCGA